MKASKMTRVITSGGYAYYRRETRFTNAPTGWRAMLDEECEVWLRGVQTRPSYEGWFVVVGVTWEGALPFDTKAQAEQAVEEWIDATFAAASPDPVPLTKKELRVLWQEDHDTWLAEETRGCDSPYKLGVCDGSVRITQPEFKELRDRMVQAAIR